MSEESIRKQAKALMDEFLLSLEEAENVKEEVGVERENNSRVPSKCEWTETFSNRMLENAPSKKNRCVAAEKKKW